MYRISYRHSKKIATRALPGSPLTRRDQVLLALLSRTSDAVPVTYGDTNPHLSSVSELRHLSNCVSPGTQRPVPASSLRPSLSTPPPPNPTTPPPTTTHTYSARPVSYLVARTGICPVLANVTPRLTHPYHKRLQAAVTGLPFCPSALLHSPLPPPRPHPSASPPHRPQAPRPFTAGGRRRRKRQARAAPRASPPRRGRSCRAAA